jgi:hypothetical protein
MLFKASKELAPRLEGIGFDTESMLVEEVPDKAIRLQ